MIMKTEKGFKKLSHMPINSKVKQDACLMIDVEMINFRHINDALTVQINDGSRYFIDILIVGQVKVGKKVILITDKCEMFIQYKSRFGYELPVYKEDNDEPIFIVKLDRKDLTKSKTGETLKLHKVIGNVSEAYGGSLLRAKQLYSYIVDELKYTLGAASQTTMFHD